MHYSLADFCGFFKSAKLIAGVGVRTAFPLGDGCQPCRAYPRAYNQAEAELTCAGVLVLKRVYILKTALSLEIVTVIELFLKW